MNNTRKKVAILETTYNYFGDTILSFIDEDIEYPLFQYNCRGAKDLRKRINIMIENNYAVFIVEEVCGFNRIEIVPALPYVERIIKLDADVAELERIHGHSFSCNGPGAEIAGRYGY